MLKGTEYERLQGEMNVEIKDVVYHSKNAGPNTMFVCIEGADFDGHTFAKEAARKGSAVILCSKPLSFRENVTVILVADTRKAMAEIAAAFYGYPSKNLRLIGVTGTKGKTTVSYLLRDIFLQSGIKCGMIGTVENDTGRRIMPSLQTTPESVDLQKMLREMVDGGCEAAVIEVSSQALKQGRVHGLVFDVAILTSLSSDHIGPKEHENFEEYCYWKYRIFHQCKAAVINGDIRKFSKVDDRLPAGLKVRTYGLHSDADLWAENLDFVKMPGKLGVEFQSKGRYNIKLVIGAPGLFSVYNGLAAVLAAKLFDLSDVAIKKAFMEVRIPGRQELFPVGYDKLILVDYAHNGTALEALLSGLRKYHPQRLTCVFGCGGERDTTRRFEMGRVAAKYADYSIITADNPRKESLDSIIRDIIEGMEPISCNYKIIRKRQDAIEYGVQHCLPGEIVVIAGKGHEHMQLLSEGAIHFDDREIVRASIEKVKYEQDYNRGNQRGM